MKQLLWFAALALVLFFAAALFANDSAARDRALADADGALVARARFCADALDQALQLRMVQVFTFAALPSLRGFAASDEEARPARMAVAHSELRAILAADPNVRAVSIVDTAGIVILTTDGSMFADWRARAFVRDALAGRLHVSPPAREFGEISQFYSAPILDNFGDVAGALVLRVAAQELWNILRAQTNLLLVDEYGVRLADRSERPQHFIALTPLSAEESARALAEGRYGVEVMQIHATHLVELADAVKHTDTTQVTFRDSTGQTIRAATRRLSTNPWTVIAFEREETLLAPTRAILFDQIRLVVVTVLVTIGAVYVVQILWRGGVR